MKVSITFECDNAAFEDDFKSELRHVLRKAEALVEGSIIPGSCLVETRKILDSNGNTVGRVMVSRMGE